MKNYYLFTVLLCISKFCFCQLTVTTNPVNANICAGNSVSITASATPVNYSIASIANNAYDPTLFSTTVLVDQLNSIIVPVSTGTLDDGRWDNISLPFSFTFYGNTFNAVNISTNGWVGLGSTNSTTTGYGVALPNAAAPNNVIHAISSDLTFAGTSNAAVLQYFEAGTSPNKKFVIDYSNIKFFTGTATADVQIILYETTNVIEIHTTNCTNTADSKAQGLENSTGTLASIATGRNNTVTWTGMPDAFRFTPDNINFTWSPASGLNTTTGATVVDTPVSTTTYTVSAVNTSNGFTGNTTVTVTIDPASYTLAAVAGGPQICQNISVSPTGTNFRDGNCNLIATIVPAGAVPVSNSINTCIQSDTGSTKRGTSVLYLARKYDIEPLLNPYPATSTANITLYYLQNEFDNYNSKAADSGYKALPIGPADATGISNLVLKQFHGTGTNPTNYSGPSQDFTIAQSGFTVVWNATRSWWEVTVPVTSFSGFYITSQPINVLPVKLEYFKGMQVDNKRRLNWKVNCTSASVVFEIQRSGDGLHFVSIATLSASQTRCNQPFEYTDEQPLNGINFYRIKVIDADDKSYFSNTITLKTNISEILSISPNPALKENTVLKINATKKCRINIQIADYTARIISNQTADMIPGINQIILNTCSLTRGTYLVTIYANGQKPETIKFIRL